MPSESSEEENDDPNASNLAKDALKQARDNMEVAQMKQGSFLGDMYKIREMMIA